MKYDVLSPANAPSAPTQDHRPEPEVTLRADDAGRDQHRLAGHEREERVHHRDREDQRVGPGRTGDDVDQPLVHAVKVPRAGSVDAMIAP